MKTYAKSLCAMAALFLLTFVSCVDEPAGGGNDELISVDGIATVQEQINSIETSVEDLQDLQTMLESKDYSLEGAIQALEDHVASLKAGAPLLEGTLATLEQQKNLAAEVGALQAKLADDSKLDKEFYALEKGVAKWIGKNFNAFYPLATAEAKAHALLADFAEQIYDQKLYVDAVSSDVEAGLREGVALDELTALYASVVMNEQDADKLGSSLASAAEELEQNYIQVLTSAVSEREAIDGAALAKLNQAAQAQTLDVDNTLAGLISRVAAVQAQLEDIITRLEDLEANVNELLGMIQSLTFVSEYSDDKAVAYYEMTNDINQERYAEGKRNRVPAETFDLTFLVRPAAVADALAQTWQKSLSVIGYYANSIQLHSTENIQEFQIVDAVSTTGKGLITVTVKNAFDDDFYFREKGAKLALAVESGKTNCASKFVEIVPRDITGKIYAESIKLTPDTLSIQDGDTYKLVAEVVPSNVTDQGFVWYNYGSDYFSVDENGFLKATKVGNSPVEVTANATDEFGRSLSARCYVMVTPSIKIGGPDYVEQGGRITLTLQSPDVIYPNDVNWDITVDAYGANVNNFVRWTKDESTGNLEIEGLNMFYNIQGKEYYKLVARCTIGQANPITITKDFRVVCPQPHALELKNGLPNDADEVTVKINQTYNLAANILPAEAANTNYFRCKYESNAEHYVDCGIANYEGLVTAVGVGTAKMKIIALDHTSSGGSYFYPKGGSYIRHIDIHVEPYYITNIILQESYEFEPGETGTLSATLVSDGGDDVQPTYRDLIWSSSDPDVLYVDPDSGDYEAKALGRAVITAKAPESAVSGGATIVATSNVTVLNKVNTPNPGDFLYADGTWSSTNTASANNPVVGVVFWSGNPTRNDSRLASAAPTATNGLAVALAEYGGKMGYIHHESMFFVRNNYDLNDDEHILGYSYTYYMSEYAKSQGDTKSYDAGIGNYHEYPVYNGEMYRSDIGVVAQHSSSVESPGSPWYVPSYFEMTLLYKEKVAVNSSLSKVGGSQISNAGYWVSNSVRLTKSGNYWDPKNGMLFDMSNGEWGENLGQFGASSTQAKASNTTYPVRVVLAF